MTGVANPVSPSTLVAGIVVRVCEARGMQEALDELEPLVAALGARALFGLADRELVAVLRRVHGLISALSALAAGLAGEAAGRGLPTQSGYRSTQTWLRDALHLSGGGARQLLRLAEVADEFPTVGAAVATGAVTADQALAIGAALGELRARVPADVVAAAQDRLLDCATSLSPDQLQIAAGRVLAHVAPAIADAHDAEALRRAEQRARIGRGIALMPDRGNHRFRLCGYLTPEMAATFTAAIEPLAGKRPGWNGVDVDERSAPQRRADALVEICQQALTADKQPGTGADRPQIAITVDFDTLRQQTSAGVLDTGFGLTPAAVRRLACDAKILPAVMNGASQVLDLGRAQRTWTGPARRAVILRDKGCVFPDCDKPPAWCDIHHIQFFSRGGATDLSNAAMLCGFHHYLIHHSDWTIGLDQTRATGRHTTGLGRPTAGATPQRLLASDLRLTALSSQRRGRNASRPGSPGPA